MKAICRLGLISLAIFAAACARQSTTLAQSHNGIEIQLVAAYANGNNLLVTLCYQQPSGANWVPGRHADDATIAVAGETYVSSSLDLVGFRASAESAVIYRCDRLTFDVPAQPRAEVFRLTIAHMVGATATSSDCPEVQRTLEAEAAGIRINCMEDPEGFFSYALLERPHDMTDLEAAYFVDDLAGEVIAGPWEFDFTVAHPDEQ